VARREGSDVDRPEGDLAEPVVISPDQLAEVVSLVIAQVEVSRTWVAPLPDPPTMRSYEDVLPGSAERILRMAVSLTTDVSAREDRLVDAEIESARFGRWAAAGLTVAFLAAAVGFFAIGNIPAGAILLGVPVAMILRSFFVDLRRGGGKPDAGE